MANENAKNEFRKWKNAYQREWFRKNPKKQAVYNARYWARKVQEMGYSLQAVIGGEK